MPNICAKNEKKPCWTLNISTYILTCSGCIKFLSWVPVFWSLALIQGQRCWRQHFARPWCSNKPRRFLYALLPKNVNTTSKNSGKIHGFVNKRIFAAFSYWMLCYKFLNMSLSQITNILNLSYHFQTWNIRQTVHWINAQVLAGLPT